MNILNPSTASFFQNIANAIFTNPFSENRENLDRKLIDSSKTWPALVDDILVDLKKHLSDLKPIETKNFSSETRKLVRSAILFDVFHTYGDSFNEHIIHQLDHPEKIIAVSFAEDLLEELNKVGFSKTDALSYFAFMFQLRRAYYFISISLIGSSKSMQKMREDIWSSIFTHDLQRYIDMLWQRMEDFSTLLLGETGSGKGVVAAAIGQSGWIPFDPKKGSFSWPFTQSFVASNLSEYTSSLIESALFGHQRGAFTGAIRDSKGLFEQCRTHGTIFLDEIGELTFEVQVKLLRVLQERVFTPVGGQESKRFDGRVIAATNIAHDQLRDSKFRSDFYYRLSSVIIEVPSLKTRIAENPKELEELLSVIVPRVLGTKDPVILKEMITLSKDFLDYAWPGNVRELEQFVRRVLITGTYHGELVQASPDLLSTMSAKEVLSHHAASLSAAGLNIAEISRRMQIDRRTVQKYLKG